VIANRLAFHPSQFRGFKLLLESSGWSWGVWPGDGKPSPGRGPIGVVTVSSLTWP